MVNHADDCPGQVGAESLFIASWRLLFVTVPFGEDRQFPVSLAFRLPTPTQYPLYVMVTSQVCPLLRAWLQHSRFLSDQVLLGSESHVPLFVRLALTASSTPSTHSGVVFPFRNTNKMRGKMAEARKRLLHMTNKTDMTNM